MFYFIEQEHLNKNETLYEKLHIIKTSNEKFNSWYMEQSSELKRCNCNGDFELLKKEINIIQVFNSTIEYIIININSIASAFLREYAGLCRWSHNSFLDLII